MEQQRCVSRSCLACAHVLAKAALLPTAPAHRDMVQCVTFRPPPSLPAAGRTTLLASSSRDATVAVWSASTGVELQRLRLPRPGGGRGAEGGPFLGGRSVSVGQRKRLWLAAAWVPEVSARMAEALARAAQCTLRSTSRPAASWRSSRAPTWEICCIGSGALALVHACCSHCVHRTRPRALGAGQEVQPQPWAPGHSRPVFAILPCPPPTTADALHPALLPALRALGPAPAAASPPPLRRLCDGWCITVSMDRHVALWSMQTRKPRWSVACLGGYVYAVATSARQPTSVLAGVGEGTLRVWDARANARNPLANAMVWQDVAGKVTCVALHPQLPQLVVYGTQEGRVGMMDLDTGASACERLSVAAVLSVHWCVAGSGHGPSPGKAERAEDGADSDSGADSVSVSDGSRELARSATQRSDAPGAARGGAANDSHTTSSLLALSSDGAVHHLLLQLPAGAAQGEAAAAEEGAEDAAGGEESLRAATFLDGASQFGTLRVPRDAHGVPAPGRGSRPRLSVHDVSAPLSALLHGAGDGIADADSVAPDDDDDDASVGGEDGSNSASAGTSGAVAAAASVTAMAVHCDARTFAAGTKGGIVHVLRCAAAPSDAGQLPGSRSLLEGAQHVAHGRSACQHVTVVLWAASAEPNGRAAPADARLSIAQAGRAAREVRAGDVLAVAHTSGMVALMAVLLGPPPEPVDATAAPPAGSSSATASGDAEHSGVAVLRTLAQLKGHRRAVSSMAWLWLPGLSALRLATGSVDATVQARSFLSQCTHVRQRLIGPCRCGMC